MKQRVMLEVYVRGTPRGPLDRRLGWFADLSNAEGWTLLAELQGLLSRYPQGTYDRANASVEEIERATAQERARNGHL